jgi:tRNA(Ile)-lysidine synthase
MALSTRWLQRSATSSHHGFPEVIDARLIRIASFNPGRQAVSVTLENRIPWFEKTPRGGPWLVAVSGGADSVALLHLLVDAGFEQLVVCHLNHRLRGAASTRDARFVAGLAKRLGLACEIGRADVRGRMKTCRESMETAARNARHEFFAECAVKHQCERVLLAHHADDQAETVLWNLLRGSHGLKGMKEEHNIEVPLEKTVVCLNMIRPLLGLRHADLMAWLESRGLSWCEDESNQQAVAVRNRLRHEVFPLLDAISGRDAVAAMVRAAADAAEQAEWMRDLLAQAQVRDPQGRLHIGALRELHPLLQREALRAFLIEHGIQSLDRTLLDRALALLDVTGPAALNLTGGGRLRRKSGRIRIEPGGQGRSTPPTAS